MLSSRMFEELAVVIPWRDVGDYWRNASWKYIRQSYFEIGIEPIFYGDSGDEIFSRSASRNLVVREVAHKGYKNLLIADADTLPFANSIGKGLDLLDQGAAWCIPYGNAGYFNVDQKSTETILMGSVLQKWTPEDVTWDHQLESWAGQLLVSLENFNAIGGYDERFIAWGYEDSAFQVALDAVCGPHERVEEGYTMALWHPAPEETTWGQPYLEHNRNLYNEYLMRQGNREAMLRYLENR